MLEADRVHQDQTHQAEAGGTSRLILRTTNNIENSFKQKLRKHTNNKNTEKIQQNCNKDYSLLDE